jgi:hypothetical protein
LGRSGRLGTLKTALKASRKPIKLRGLAEGLTLPAAFFNNDPGDISPGDINPIRICH